MGEKRWDTFKRLKDAKKLPTFLLLACRIAALSPGDSKKSKSFLSLFFLEVVGFSASLRELKLSIFQKLDIIFTQNSYTIQYLCRELEEN